MVYDSLEWNQAYVSVTEYILNLPDDINEEEKYQLFLSFQKLSVKYISIMFN